MSYRMTSPREMIAEAKFQMLDNREPESREDWALVMNFCAANVHKDVADSACRLIAMIYHMPLSSDEVSEIVAFQLARR